MSTAHVYKSQGKAPCDESAPLGPWTVQAQFRLEAEQTLRALDGLHTVTLRPAVVYGPADCTGLMPRCVCAAAYAQLGETMKFLWDKGMKLNTVHVLDVCRAMWHVSQAAVAPGAIFNLADKGDTDQGAVSGILGSAFGIKTGFHGALISNLARINMDDVVDSANEKHMQPWAALCKEHGLQHSPLSPFQHKELLRHNHLYVDGGAIEGTGFQYARPAVTEEEIVRVLVGFVEQGLFPALQDSWASQ
jgi:nucleoside-diphosphate-sugar epimerase